MSCSLALAILLTGCGGTTLVADAPVSTTQPAAGFALPGPLALKSASESIDCAYLTGGEFNADWFCQRVEALDGQAVFTPVDGATPSNADMAVAIYRLNFGPMTPESLLYLDWLTAPAAGKLWVGLSYWGDDNWTWLCPADPLRVDIEPLAPHIDAAGELYAALIVTGDTPAVLGSTGMVLSWWCFGHDRAGSRRSTHVGPADNHLRWTFPTSSYVNSSPVVGPDGTIYVGSDCLHAINPDGGQQWAYLGCGTFDGPPALGPDGTLYAAGLAGNLCAVNADGSERWVYPVGGLISGGVAVGLDGAAYVGSTDKNLHAVNPDGTPRWVYPTDGMIRSTPSIGPDGTVYIGDEDGTVYAVRADGSPGWTCETGDNVRSTPTIGPDGTVYFGSHDGYLYAVNRDGSAKWSYELGDQVRSSPALGADGTVYAASANGNLYALTPTGDLKWTFETGGWIYTSPTLDAEDTVYIASSDGFIYAIKSDQSVKWTYDTGQPLNYSSAAIGPDGAVYVGDGGDNLLAFGPDLT
ncbi:PQQ-like beta-propeller repeat protein [bacterium]|nr:PQQ-like beta-propeller repeat protein [bacterium]